MKSINCLNEQTLVLHYYNEIPASSEEVLHLDECTACRERFHALSKELDSLPQLSCLSDHAAGTRMAARVSEQLTKRRGRRFPALGVYAGAAIALVVTLFVMAPGHDPAQTIQLTTSTLTATNLTEEMPDIDFLEDLELLQELELLSQIEGV
jgi:predicted anti-sigma-YlaC factor YlaD